MPIVLENFRPFLCEKTLYPGAHLGLNHSCLLTSANVAKNYEAGLVEPAKF